MYLKSSHITHNHLPKDIFQESMVLPEFNHQKLVHLRPFEGIAQPSTQLNIAEDYLNVLKMEEYR